MKLIQLDFQKPCYKFFPVVVEVPDDFPTDRVASLLSEAQLADASSQGCELHDADEPAECTNVYEISSDVGAALYKLVGNVLVKT